MILRSIRVSGWRCFADPIEAGPFREGLNVIHAPNACGKSTLFEAMLRGLLDAHRVGGREVEAIRPWGRDLAPTVTVEFSHGGHEYRITKRFLDSPSSRLERKENGHFVGLAEAGKADETVRAMITRSPPGRGLARPENWGLAQVLWTAQGELALEGLSGDVVEDISASLKRQVAGPAAGPLERRVEEAYLRVYTPGGKYRTGKDAAPVVHLGEKLEAARAERTVALERQRRYEESSRLVEDLRAARTQAGYDAEAIGKELKEARARAGAFQKLASEKKETAARAREEEARHTDLKRRVEDIAGARKGIAEAAAALGRMEEDLPLHERLLRQREKEEAEARSALEDARRGRPGVDAARELAEQAREFADNNAALEALAAEVAKIAAAQEDQGKWKKERAELVAPDQGRLKAIRQAVKKRDEARLLVGRSLITLQVVPEGSGRLVIVAGDDPGEVGLSPGVPAQATGSPEVVAELPGVCRIRASIPVGSVKEHRQEQAAAERELRELTKPFGTADIESLEALLEKRRRLDRKISDADSQIEAWLSGRTLDQLRLRHSEAQAIRTRMALAHPEWQGRPPDPAALKAAADDAGRAFVNRVEKVESAWEAAQQALATARVASEGAGSQAQAARAAIRGLQERLADLTSDGKSDQQRARELAATALSWDAARAMLEGIEAALSDFGDDPVDTAARLDKQAQKAEEAASRALIAENREERHLEDLNADGTYSLLAVAEERVAALEAEFAAHELGARAIHLLRHTLAGCRDEALAAVAGPVEAAATRMLARMAGGRLGRLELGRAFGPSDVHPEISGQSVSLDNVSGGEKEQAYLATRLALAEVLAGQERQMVVLDDAMTCTDARRMARVMAILEEEAGRLQIIILTCHPERYRGLEGAGFLDLEALVREASQP